MVERIFDDEPAAEIEEAENKGDQKEKAQSAGTAGVRAWRTTRGCCKIIVKSHEAEASYLAMTRWSIGGAQATLSNRNFGG
jgi:hypothetical protein